MVNHNHRLRVEIAALCKIKTHTQIKVRKPQCSKRVLNAYRLKTSLILYIEKVDIQTTSFIRMKNKLSFISMQIDIYNTVKS